MSTSEGIKLKDLRFSAKFDFITISVPHRLLLPKMDGKVKWPRKYGGTRLTIHDPSAVDLVVLKRYFPHAGLAELEVAVDIRPAERLVESADKEALEFVKAELVAKRLQPEFDAGLNGGFRGAYKRTHAGYKLTPFNRRVPTLEEQLLYGHRNDGVQVKVYHKKTDQNQDLEWSRHAIRVEVRIGLVGLDAHGLICLTDLFDFRFRSDLMPYFRHMRGITSLHKNPQPTILNRKVAEFNTEHWNKTGVGAFERGGFREASRTRLLRDSKMNDRIGQALLRLERNVRFMKFVCYGEDGTLLGPGLARPAGDPHQSCMTYQVL